MLLLALEPGRYHAAGAYQPETGPAVGIPLEWNARFSREGDRAVFEGTYQHCIGEAEHLFRLTLFLPVELLGRGRFELESRHLDVVRGDFRVVGGAIVFAGIADDKMASLTLNLGVSEAGALEAKGVLFRSAERPWFFWFNAREMPTELAKANVVGLHTKQG